MTEPSDESWIDKYRPTTFSEIQGNNAAIDRLHDWAKAFPADTTPRLLVGPPGTGKTTTVEVIADSLNLQVVEMNASSARKSDDVEEMAALARNRTADGERRVVLLDEVDSWHHAANKRPLYDALDSPANLVFCTANDKWETPSALVTRCEVETFKLGTRSIKAKLKDIRDAEDLPIDDDALGELAAQSPDLRTAINDLQAFGDAPDLLSADREWEVSEWDMVDSLMTGGTERGDLNPQEILMWLDENLSKDWRGLELAWGHEALSRLDVAIMQDKRAAEAIADTLPALRLTEPYYDDHIGRKKSFPEWFRHSSPKASGGSAEAKLYRALTNYDSGEFSLGCSYSHFREIHLPTLRDLSEEERFELILAHGLGPEEYEALDVTEAAYTDWLEVQPPEKGDGLTRTEDASAW